MKQRVSKKIIFASVSVVLAAALLIFFFNYDTTSSPDFQGTYASGNGPNTIYFSVDQKDDVFFYADQSQALYITGSVNHLSDTSYELVCTDTENQKILGNQTIVYQDPTFQLTVAGFTIEFQKIDSIPTVFGDVNQYH